MACTSIVAVPKACGSKVQGGINKLYIIGFEDLAPVAGSPTGEVYAVTSGLVSNIGLDASKKFVEIGLLKETAGLSEKWTIDPSKGSAFSTQTATLAVSDLTSENRTFITSLMNRPVAILFKARTGKYYVAGLNGEFELSDLEGGTGTAAGDLNGYNLTFSGIASDLITQVDPTLIATLID